MWLTSRQLEEMGFSSIGKNVLVSDKASFYNCPKIKLGNNIRIDDFCVISAGEGGIEIGNHVHIAVYASLIGAGKITISDFCGISSKVAIYSSNDDYSGAFLTGPTISSEYTNVHHADVFLDKHVVIGSGSVLLPGVAVGLGTAVGALSLVRHSCKPFGIYVGNPARFLKERRQDLLKLEESFLREKSESLI
ncbi:MULTISPECIES: acyltransferase [unclassified Legionella]|uniref:acyltransferase n=1 Tax=unclassified Legionella TaxID=2622702 RepID=UPI001054612F|nr:MULTISPECIES: acyltransferase [unclassified Legionella]MDI9817772.1 acyltransferase [Legionella sp. PL877]